MIIIRASAVNVPVFGSTGMAPANGLKIVSGSGAENVAGAKGAAADGKTKS
jgi:hypothetical protein